MKTSLFPIFAAFTLLTLAPAFAQDGKPAAAKIEEKLQEIVSLRSDILKRHQALAEDDRTLRLLDVEVDLLRAKLDLAREQHDSLASRKLLTHLLTLLQRRHQEALVEVEMGRGDLEDVANRKIDILEAEIELARLEK